MRGIRAGEWQFITIPQLEGWIQSTGDVKFRVWAFLMMCTPGQGKKGRGRIATIIDEKTGKRRLLAPNDIVLKMRSSEILPTTKKQEVRRALAELEQLGMARRLGIGEDGRPCVGGRLHKNRVAIACYLRPLKAKSQNGRHSRLPFPAESSEEFEEHELRIPASDAIFNSVLSSAVRSFRRAARSLLEAMPEMVDHGAYQMGVDDGVADIEMVVRVAFQKLVMVARNAATYKEDSNSSISQSVSALPAPGAGREETDQPAPRPEWKSAGASEPDPSDDRILEAIPRDVIEEFGLPTKKLYNTIRQRLQGAPLARFTKRIIERRSAFTKLGFLENLADDVGKVWASMESERRRWAAEAERHEHTVATAQAADERWKQEVDQAWAQLSAEEHENRIRACHQVLKCKYPGPYSIWDQAERERMAVILAKAQLREEMQLRTREVLADESAKSHRLSSN